ncbi:MAG TPA: hypothetical protein VGM76_11485 [Lacipirellulaceae bacterium]|jgi:hypothetical protein
MTKRKLTAILAISLGLSCVNVGGANAADEPLTPATRGTVKVQPRFFNPFNIGVSRLSIDPFGMFTLTEPAATANPFAIGGGSAAAITSSATTTSTTTTQAQDASTAGPVTTPLTVSAQLVRPPFVPPDRSPFRVPPRPPIPP